MVFGSEQMRAATLRLKVTRAGRLRIASLCVYTELSGPQNGLVLRMQLDMTPPSSTTCIAPFFVQFFAVHSQFSNRHNFIDEIRIVPDFKGIL